MTTTKTRIESEVLGVKVVFDPDYVAVSIGIDRSRWWWPWKFETNVGICDSRGLGRRAQIVIGRGFLAFPPREQQAILLHEVGHIKLGHVLERVKKMWQIVLLPSAFARLCIRQEFQADRFAAECGYGADLARAFSRMGEAAGALHPPTAERVARLHQHYP